MSDFKRFWTPWRLEYVTAEKSKSAGCLFCEKYKQRKDDENFLVAYSEHCYIILNRYPYVNGHLLVVPYRHVQAPYELDAKESQDFFSVIRLASEVLKEAYHPGGQNIGMNVGTASGAGIAEHLHCHLVPRWVGDTNFIAVFANIRMIIETLEITYAKLKPLFIGKGLSKEPPAYLNIPSK